ncbi:MAG: DUF2304 domain-containing protein [Planctomycetota bacterium]
MTKMNAERMMLFGGIAAFLLTVYWVRSRALREKYAVVWFFVALILLLCGIFPNIIMAFAESVKLAYSSTVLFISLGAIYIFSFSVSLSLTRQYRRNIRLMQELAIMEQRLQTMERKVLSSDKAAQS